MAHVTKKLRFVMLLIGAWMPGALLASGNQYYFIAYQAPAGSITAAGQGRQVVYLRWDPVEGRLPADVVALRLLRNGELLLDDIPVDDVMQPAAIENLYRGPSQQRRLLETMLKLKARAVADGEDFPTGNFASVIWSLINPAHANYDVGWTHFASRSDINVAIARHRAFVDEPGAGSFAYELLAVSASGTTARLGYETIDTTAPQRVLGAENFHQVTTSQCDLPESARDHYTVALNWDGASTGNITDQYAASIYLAGFDLYRTKENLEAQVLDAPQRDIAAEAASANHDSRGVPLLDGLELANDTLLTVTPDRANAAEWIETHDELRRAGLKPGDKRAYYLVARDFTGNYGPTAAAIVVVPNLLRPPAPWELRPVVDSVSPGLPGGFTPTSGGRSLTLSWDAVNLDNYVRAFGHSRTVCNPAEAATSGVLEFVASGESCSTATRRAIRVDVAGYRVYRFLDFETASRFKDSDGDGVADRDERASLAQCDASVQPPGANNYLLDPAQVNLRQGVLPISGKETVRVQDAIPALPQLQGDTFWYRVASRTPDGVLSHLSAPQRGIVPNRTLPQRPEIQVRRPGRVRDGCELVVDGGTGAWSFADQVDQAGFELSCPGLKEPLLFGKSDVLYGSQACDAVRRECDIANNGSLTLTYPDPAGGGALCTIDLPGDLPPEDGAFRFCGMGQGRLVPTYGAGAVDVAAGEVSAGPLLVSVTAASSAFPDVCFDLIENIGGDHARVATSCNTANPDEIQYEVPTGFFCGYAVARDGNNNVSPAAVLPCTSVRPDSGRLPTTPQPVSIDASGTVASLSWRVAAEPIAATLISIDQHRGDGISDRQFFSYAHAGVGSGDVIAHEVPVEPLAGDSDEICVRYQAIGPATVQGASSSSGWSAPQCTVRRSGSSTLPQYLPWPMVNTAVEGTELEVGRQGLAALGGEGGLLYIDIGPVRDEKVLNVDCTSRPELFFTGVTCNRSGTQNLRAIVESAVPFLVYRQRRDEHGQPGDWIQVSPLIDYVHFDAVAADAEGRDRTLADPFIRIRQTPLESTRWRVVFMDRYPYIDGEYRYQVVYFDASHRITRWRESDWIIPFPEAP